ncbi:MAG: hypothetical protein LBM68_05160 [Bacteroidales bacterium]|nr:hypothetical protein [Bacteroidales bacterium]
MITRKITVNLFIVLLFVFCGCNKSENHPQTNDFENQSTTMSGTWKVEALYSKGELTNISSLFDNDATYSHISIIIPDTTQGIISGNTFYDTFEYSFKIEEPQQISIYNYKETHYVANELIICFAQEIDVEEFAVNSNLGVMPKRSLWDWKIWLFETNGTKPLSELIDILSQNDVVKYAQYNHNGIELRNTNDATFRESMYNTVKYEISNNELVFINAENQPIIFLTKIKMP